MENTDNNYELATQKGYATLFREHLAQTSPSPLGLEVARAEGIYLYTPDGRRITDLISGVSVSVVGHSRAEVVAAVQKQAAEFMHTMVYGETVMAPQVEYARRLCSLLPAGLQSVYFVNSGSEAIEGALKLAKRFSGRRETVAFRQAYHGSTHGALSLMSSPEGDAWRAPFEPLPGGVGWLEFNDFSALGAITETTACVVVEPVQGEAGVRIPCGEFLKELRERCTQTGTLLIFDEIQTGMGRTGRLFAFEKYGVVPDILCLAKAFGGGLPLGAFISSREIMSTLSHSPALGHITTFGGNPVCCAAGLAALDVLLSEDLLAEVETKGALFESLLGGHEKVREIRRAGLLMAVELIASSDATGDRRAETSGEGEGKPVATDEAKASEPEIVRLMQKLLRTGILSDWFLFCDTAFRISPPLTITEAEIRETCATIIECLNEK